MAIRNSDGERFGTIYPERVQIDDFTGGKIRRYHYLNFSQRVNLMLELENIPVWAEEENVDPAGELVTFAFSLGCEKNYLFSRGRVAEKVLIQRGLSGIYNFYSDKNMPAGLRRIRYMAEYYLCRNDSGDWAATPIIKGEDAVCDYNVASNALNTYCRLRNYVCGQVEVARISLGGGARSFAARIAEVLTQNGDRRLIGMTFFGSYLFEVSAADVAARELIQGNFNDGISRWIASGADYLHVR